jgi:hypothetical protein
MVFGLKSQNCTVSGSARRKKGMLVRVAVWQIDDPGREGFLRVIEDVFRWARECWLKARVLQLLW